MAKVSKRYYSGDDSEIGVTPSQLKRLGRKRQLEYVVYWFNSMFIDPVHDTPRDEGEYIYIHGGPYEAEDEIYSEFRGLISDKILEKAVEEVGSDGIVEWAPSSIHPDMIAFHDDAAQSLEEDRDDESGLEQDLARAVRALEAGLDLRFDDDEETLRRQDLLADLARLREVLPPSPGPAQIGHNGPPPDDEDVPPSIMEELRQVVATVGVELARAKPAALIVARAAWEAVKWAGRKIDKALDAFAPAAGIGIAGVVVADLKPEIAEAVRAFGASALRWLTHLIGG